MHDGLGSVDGLCDLSDRQTLVVKNEDLTFFHGCQFLPFRHVEWLDGGNRLAGMAGHVGEDSTVAFWLRKNGLLCYCVGNRVLSE